MKIAAISTSKVPSATANSIQMLMACQGLAENGHEVLAIVPGSGKTDFETIRSQYGLRAAAPFVIRHVTSRKWLRRLDFSFDAAREAKKIKADLVYAWTIQAAFIASKQGFRVIFEVHDLPAGRFGRRWFQGLVKSRTLHRFVFITAALKESVQQEFPQLPDSDCIIAPNGFTPEDYMNLPDRAAAKKQMGFPDAPIVSCSGHLYQGRGVNLFLELAKVFPAVNFYWFGGQPDQVSRFQENARNSGLENVRFTGFIPKERLPLAQAASDVLLMPYECAIAGSSGGNSAAICSPMKMFEYMAAERPIISSDLPVIHEVLDSASAVFCEPDDVDAWRSALRCLLDDPTGAARLSATAKRKSDQYSWKKRQEAILERLYTEEKWAKADIRL